MLMGYHLTSECGEQIQLHRYSLPSAKSTRTESKEFMPDYGCDVASEFALLVLLTMMILGGSNRRQQMTGRDVTEYTVALS